MAAVSRRLNQIPASPIRKLVPLADEAKKRGVQVIHLNIGDPDIPTPQVMIDRLKSWEGGIPYAHSQGDSELLDALTAYYHRLGYDYLTRENVQVTVGGSEALAMAMTAICDPGEEIIVFEPFFVGYASLAPVYGVRLVPVMTRIENGFHLPNIAEIENKITAKTRAILFTNPNNPTGTVYSKAEVEKLIDIAQKHNLFLFCDEVYREFVFPPSPKATEGQASFKGVSSLDYMREEPEQVIVLDSLSKRYSAPGLRLGMIVSLNQELMAGVLRMAMGRLSAGYIDQKVAAELTQVSHEEILAVRDEYNRRREVIYKGMKQIPGVTIQKPEGAFYCVVGLPVDDAEKFCAWLLTDFNDQGQTVMLAPMPGFYATPGLGKQEVRIAYVVGEAKLKRAIEILGKALQTYKS